MNPLFGASIHLKTCWHTIILMNKAIIVISIGLMLLMLFGCTTSTKATAQDTINDLNIRIIKTTADLNNLQLNYAQLQLEKTQLVSTNTTKDTTIIGLQNAINALNLQIARKENDLNVLQISLNYQLLQKTIDLNVLQTRNTQLESDNNKLRYDNNILLTNGFTWADRNYLTYLTYIGGFCERQGLVTSFRTSYNTDLNRYEGIPVCIVNTVPVQQP